MKEFFYYKKEYADEFNLPKGFSVKKYRPYKSLHNVIWHFLSKGNFFRYDLMDEEKKLVCVCHVIGRTFQFPFMDNKSLHIGPCYTLEKYRGKGYYPLLLKFIMGQSKNRTFYMIVDKKNIASIRGIEKAEFKKIGIGIRTKYKQYLITDYLE